MAKQGMKRPKEKKKKKAEPAVPEIQSKAKAGNKKATPIIEGTKATDIKVYHSVPFDDGEAEKEISSAYPAIDTDLARDNLQNDIPEADLQDI